MAPFHEVQSQLESYNIRATTDVINKFVDMCVNYNLSAEDVVDEWFAFMSSNSLNETPTVELLQRMERKNYKKKLHDDQDNRKMFIQSDCFSNSKKALNTLTSTPQSKHTAITSTNIINSPSTPRSTYEKRSNKSQICCSYGNSNATFKGNSDTDLTVKFVLDNNLKPDSSFMHETLENKTISLDNTAVDLLLLIFKKHNLEASHDNDIIEYFAGRIASDEDNTLNEHSILLQLIESFRGEQLLPLDLRKLERYAVFPGQIVVVKGEIQRNLRTKSDYISVSEIYTDGNFMLPVEPPIRHDPLQIVVACGPFTVQDNLKFAPLYDLLNYVKEHKPNALILVGPFYDTMNEGILNNELIKNFSEFYEELIDIIMDSLKDSGIHVVVVSSYNESHHYPIYPTPPYNVTENYKNLTFTSDPSMINLNGLIIGITSADILFHMGKYEFAVDKTNPLLERMNRFISHVLKQQTFYPLYPEHEDISIDYGWKELYDVMPVKPHILILPSKLQYFIKQIDECLVINPEKLTKFCGGGTFARIEIQPGETTNICTRTSCQVLRI